MTKPSKPSLELTKSGFEEVRLSPSGARDENRRSLIWKFTTPYLCFLGLASTVWNLPRQISALVTSIGGMKPFFISLIEHIKLAGLRRTFSLGVSRLRQTPQSITMASNFALAMVAKLRPILESQLERVRSDGFTSEANLISIIMPVFRPRIEFLQEAIESVLIQSYRNFELVLIDDGSQDEDLVLFLSSLASKDNRLRLIQLENNQGISGATNAGISASRGSLVAFMDQDDRLEPSALEAIVRTFQINPFAKVTYSDEAIISSKGSFLAPHLKPAFDPILLMQVNYITHLVTFSRDFLEELGPLESNFDGLQDHEILLRAIASLKNEEVFHIPHVLYHWRAHRTSTAGNPLAKGYLAPKRREMTQGFLNQQGVTASVAWNLDLDPELGGIALKLRPNSEPLVSIIIPTKDRFDLLSRTVESLLRRTDYSNYEIVLVDNGTTEVSAVEYISSLETQGLAKIVRDDGPFNFSRLVNSGVLRSSGELVCLLNNDVEVRSSDWLTDLVAWSQQPGVGAVGARLWFPNDTLQHGGVVLGLGISRVAGHSHKGLPLGAPGYLGRASYHQAYTAVTGACLLVSRDNFNSVGGFEEDLGVAYNDVDFCLKLHSSGLYNVWSPVSNLTHFESASRGYDTSPAKIRRAYQEVKWMQDKWGDFLEMDPSYHPLLTRADESFGLAADNYGFELLGKSGLFRRRFR